MCGYTERTYRFATSKIERFFAPIAAFCIEFLHVSLSDPVGIVTTRLVAFACHGSKGKDGRGDVCGKAVYRERGMFYVAICSHDARLDLRKA